MSRSQHSHSDAAVGVENSVQINQHPLLWGANDKGGVGKTADVVALADSLQALGYNVRLVDADMANKTLKKIYPNCELLDYANDDQLGNFITGVKSAGTDITLVDMPGESGVTLGKFLTPARLAAMREQGIRNIVGLALTQDSDAMTGAYAWAINFYGYADFIGLANGAATPFNQSFSIDHLVGAAEITEMLQGRIVYVPRLQEEMLEKYRTVKAPPSAFLVGGRAYKKLNLNWLTVVPWQTHQKAILTSVAKHAEWLVGKPIPHPPDSANKSTAPSVERNRLLSAFKEKVGEQ